jgi:hypothetical protein
MTDDLKVRVDGVRSEPDHPVPRSTLVMVVAAFVVGLGLGVLIVPNTPDAPSPESGLAAPEDASHTLSPPETGGISDVVTGFPDALVAVRSDNGSGLQHLLWPVQGPLVEQSMDTGENLKFDSSSLFIAHTTTVPGLEGWVLSMGRYNTIRPFVSGVTSFAWHDATSGSLAFTTEVGGEAKLWVVGADLQPEQVGFELAAGMRLATWGDWGWALDTGDNHTMLLNPEGELRAEIRGEPIASFPTGWILVGSEGYQLVSAGGGIDGLIGQPDIGFLREARFSPDGGRVALAGSYAVAILNLKADGVAETLPGPGSSWVAWSSDSRFLVLSARRGLRIHDLENGSSDIVLEPQTIVVGDVIPLSTP